MMAGRQFGLFLCLLSCVYSATVELSSADGLIAIKPDIVYTYDYDGRVNIQHGGEFHVTAEVSLNLIEELEEVFHCLLTVNKFNMKFMRNGAPIRNDMGIVDVNSDAMDFDDWFSFHMSRHGEIKDVLYPDDDDQEVVNLKKSLIGQLSARLHSTPGTVKTGRGWSYKVNERNDEGDVKFTYDAKQGEDGLRFVKRLENSNDDISNFDRNVTRDILYDEGLQMPKTIHVVEHVVHRKTSPNEDDLQRRKRSSPESIMNENEISEALDMFLPDVSSNGMLSLKESHPISNKNRKDMPANLIVDSLVQKQIKEPPTPIHTVIDDINTNVTCMRGYRHHSSFGSKEYRVAQNCSRHLRHLLSKLSDEDLAYIADAYIDDVDITDADQGEDFNTIIDILGALATPASQLILTKKVLLSRQPDAKLITDILPKFLNLVRPPPALFTDTLTDIALKEKYKFKDSRDTRLVINRSLLVLGSVARCLLRFNDPIGRKIFSTMQDDLDNPDPDYFTNLEATMSREEIANKIASYAVKLIAYGKSETVESYKLLLKYMKNLDYPLELRRAAVVAIGKYQNAEAARELFERVMIDPKDSIRLAALRAYEKHTHGEQTNDVMYMSAHRDIMGNTSATNRIRRHVYDQHRQIPLDPSLLKWSLPFGTFFFGGSIDVTAENPSTVIVDPFYSEIGVNYHADTAASGKIGIFEDDPSLKGGIFKVSNSFLTLETSVMGKIKFDGVNIMHDSKYKHVEDLVSKYDRIVYDLIERIREPVVVFQTQFFDESGLTRQVFEELGSSIHSAVAQVKNLRMLARDCFNRTVGQFTGWSSLYRYIGTVMERIDNMLNNIKTDVVSFFNNIVDPVDVHAPWAIEQLESAIGAANQGISKLFDSPNVGISDVRKSVLKMQASMDTLVFVSERLDSLLNLDSGSVPYWMDLKQTGYHFLSDIANITSLLDQAKVIVASTETTVAYELFTGVNEATVKMSILEAVESGIVDLISPLRDLLSFTDPLKKSHTNIMVVMEDMKVGFEDIKRGFEFSRSQINEIFGAKIAKEFPRHYGAGDAICGTGFFPTTTGNTLPGLDVKIEEGSEVVAPFDGIARTTDHQEVTIYMYNDSVSNELHDMEVILSPMELDHRQEEHPVYKGEVIGWVKRSSCNPNTLHVAIKPIDSDFYLDAGLYLEKRDIVAEWEEEENLLIVSMKDDVSIYEPFLESPKYKNTSPGRIGKRVFALSMGSQNGTNDVISRGRSARFDDAIQITGFPVADELGPDREFAVKDLRLGDVYDYLNDNDKDMWKDIFEELLETLKETRQPFNCVRPLSLDNTQLRVELHDRGHDIEGTRIELLERFMSPDKTCPGVHATTDANTYCEFGSDCLEMNCCADLNFLRYFHYALHINLAFNPCTKTLSVEAGNVAHSVDLSFTEAAHEDIMVIRFVDPILGWLESTITYQAERAQERVKVKMDATICSDVVDECLLDNSIIQVSFDITDCQEDLKGHDKKDGTIRASIETMTLGEFEKLLDMYGINETAVTKFMSDVRQAYTNKVIDAIDTSISLLSPNEFHRETQVMTALQDSIPTCGSYTFFSVAVPFKIWFLWFTLGFGVYGDTGVTADADFALEGMSYRVQAGPSSVDSYAEGYLDIGRANFYFRTTLTGYYCIQEYTVETVFDILQPEWLNSQEIHHNSVPLRIELDLSLILEIPGPIDKSKTLLDGFLPGWTWEMSRKYGVVAAVPGRWIDTSAPIFRPLLDSVTCVLSQIHDRDYTDPAFLLGAAAYDEESPVRLSYSVGTFPSGGDIAKDRSLGQQGVLVTTIIEDQGIPIYFTITVTNDEGLSSSTECQLPTYDTSLPTGRVTPDFLTTSHPNILRASSVITDDSILELQKEAIGYGRGEFGNQVLNWTNLELLTEEDDPYADLPPESDSMSYFTSALSGRLDSQPFETLTMRFDYNCAYRCLQYPSSKCRSFNYDYSSSDKCELLEDIQSDQHRIHQNGLFKHFERLGVGYTMEHRHEDLSLRHNDLYTFNIYARNILGYEDVLFSNGILADFTPPLPGPILNEEYDDTAHETCTDFVHEKWHHRCIEETPLPNHRFIIDGLDSATVFNGHEPLVDLLYTKANTYISANWDGYKDDETGIHGYTWSVGNEMCLDDIHQHNDPHAHIYYESEWTHEGIASGLKLDDGHYHVTVRALNKVEFGGPMATTVCHSTKYTIDTTKPFVYDVFDWYYDDTSCSLSVGYSVSDPLSDIREVDIGYGVSTRDVYVMDWQRHYNMTYITHQYCIPDGVPSWVRIRAWNNVDLYEVGHAEFPVTVDTSPPIAGDLFDGPLQGIDIEYQNVPNEICANWQNFYDPESGIGNYAWAVGTSPFAEDISPFQVLSHHSFSACASGVNLLHNTKYYSSLIAYNAGHKILNTTGVSNGVVFDATPPTQGWVIDGLDPQKDMQFSSQSSTVSANWDEFEDYESGIREYSIVIWRKSSGDVSAPWEVLQDTVFLPSDHTSFNWHHFHLQQGDQMYTHIEAINRATSLTSSSTNGFALDMTIPIMYFLGDGIVPGENAHFTASESELSVNWDFEDPESNIDYYELAVYEKYGGTKQKIYPDGSNEWEIVDADATTWTFSKLNLKTGGHYNIRVSSINRAGLSNVQDTDGVIVDPSPPRMSTVSIGSTAGDFEEISNGFVQQTDEFGITGYWSALDFESGVKTYYVGVGTNKEEFDVSEVQDMGPSTGGYIDGLELQLYNDTEGGPIYYVTVRAENGAGLLSDKMISNPIKVIPGDQIGIVIDGAEPMFTDSDTLSGDIDYQMDATVVTAYFSGFESHAHGIVHYEWAIGTAPMTDDIQPFMAAGVVVDPDEDAPGGGIGGSGSCQSLLSLIQGEKYYITVRAKTGVGNILEAISDGFTFDMTPPEIDIFDFGVAVDENQICSAVSDTCYQESGDTITAEWNIQEEESGVLFTEFCFGTYPGASNIHNCTDTSDISSIPSAMVSPVGMGQPNILYIQTLNEAGLWGQSISSAIIVDTSPPISGAVQCPEYISDVDVITCKWSGFYDTESDVILYKFGIGTEEGDDSVFPFTNLDSSYSDYSAKGLERQLNHSNSYYVTIIAINGIGHETPSYSKPIKVDTTPPEAGIVIELDGVYYVNITSGGADTSDSGHGCSTDEECNLNDAVCQKSLTSVSLSWQPFFDPETPMKWYEVAIGTTPGGTQLSDFKEVDSEDLKTTITGLDLTMVRQVFVMVRGFNQVGLSTTAVSNGVFISRTSSGLPPLGEMYVWDGNIQGVDLEFQEDTAQISGQWSFDGDPCPIETLSWSIVRFDEQEIQPMTEVPKGITTATTDGLTLLDGESYYIIVKSTNFLGHSQSIRSNGVTIVVEQLLPGHVRDGDIIGLDLQYQSSIVSLSGNWDGFGEARDIGYGTSSDSQDINHYEIAAGTDRRYPSTRADVHPFVDVGMNNSHTFHGLRLIPQTMTYYVTVRAYAASSTMTEVSSNGIKVGYGGEILSTGEITVDRYTASTSNITASWNGFLFGLPVFFYQWGMMHAGTSIEGIPCNELQNPTDEVQKLFDVYPLTNVRDDTMVVQGGLKLHDKETYKVVVVASDEAATCTSAGEKVTVDLTPPDEGEFIIGAFYDERVAYVTRFDALEVSWSNFGDEESGVDHFAIALYSAASCDDNEQFPVVHFEDVPASTYTYTFNQVNLEIDRPYFVHLKTTNNAGLTTESISMPVLLDPIQPVAGTVKDGHDFRFDVEYQYDNSTMNAVFIHLPTHDGESCPGTVYDFSQGSSADWHSITTQGVWGLDKKHRVTFQDDQLQYSGSGLSVTMTRDIQTEEMFSGAYYINDPDVNIGGTYEFDIKAASSSLQAVTSVVFWDGPEGVVGDFNVILQEIENQYGECSCCRAVETRDMSGCTDTCNCTVPTTTTDPMPDGSQWTIVEDELEGETGNYDRRSAGEPHRSIGLQLHPAVDVNGTTRSFIALWGRFQNDTSEPIYTITELEFNPEEESHTYAIRVEPDGNHLTLELSIDGKTYFVLYGFPTLSDKTMLTLSVWNRGDYVAPFDNVFDPPTTEATFNVVRMPPAVDDLCRYGEPFRNGYSPVIAFYATVGSLVQEEDLLPFTEVLRPCIPCQTSCSVYNCDESCSQTLTSEYKISLDGLSLTEWVTINGTEVPTDYFVKIMAVSASGFSETATSKGIILDQTHPIFESLYHVDLAWSPTQPTEYQGNNYTIAVNWAAKDSGSEIREYTWAIGTYPGGSDIQAYLSVGKQSRAANEQLEGVLQNRHTYYVTVRATDNAGLVTEKRSSGVTVVLDAPDTSSMICVPVMQSGDMKRLHDQGDIYIVNDQKSIGVTWKRLEDNLVGDYYFRVGTEKDLYDVIPEFLAAYNESTTVWVGNEHIYIYTLPTFNISDLKFINDECLNRICDDVVRTENDFYMEPGRTLFTEVTACSVGHYCTSAAFIKTTVMRTNDVIANSTNGESIEITLQQSVGESHSNVILRTDNGPEAPVLIAGILNKTDVLERYTSDASFTFSPFIVDPETTYNQTDRFLRDRIIKMLWPTFYVTSVARNQLPSSLDITVAYDTSGDSIICVKEPRLVYWNPDLKEWHDASHTCKDTFDVYQYDHDDCSFTVRVCGTYKDKTGHGDRTARDANDDMFTGPNLFVPAFVYEEFVNNPPVMTSLNTFVMKEDSGTLVYLLTAEDPDGDDVIFMLDENRLGDTNGEVTLGSDGRFFYRPCKYCFGRDTVGVILMENRTYGVVEPLSTKETLTVNVIPVNDNPVLFFAVDGYNLVNDDQYILSVTVEERNDNNLAYSDFAAQVGGFDVDSYDNLTVLYDSMVNYPTHGHLETDEQLRDFTFVSLNCSGFDANRQRKTAKIGVSSSFVMVPFPCNLYPPYDIDKLAWVVSRLKYIPDENYFGTDTFQINIVDSFNGHSKVLHVTVHVLENRCENGGNCTGPADDPDCTSERRSSGFERYGCVCPPGYEGFYCETDIDECLSNPCPDEYECIDQVDDYLCYCEDNCRSNSNYWLIFLIAVLASVFVLLIILLGVYLYKRTQKSNKDTGSSRINDIFRSLPSIRPLTAGSYNNRVHPMPSNVDGDSLSQQNVSMVEMNEFVEVEFTAQDNVTTSTDVPDQENGSVDANDGERTHICESDNDNIEQTRQESPLPPGANVIEDNTWMMDLLNQDGEHSEPKIDSLVKTRPFTSGPKMQQRVPDEPLEVIDTVNQRFGFTGSRMRPTVAWGVEKNDNGGRRGNGLNESSA